MTKPLMLPVTSSAVASIGYSKDEQELYIEWKKGGTWRYPHISQDVFDALRTASSVGEVANYIKRSTPGIKA
jgi:hypothetical protein